MKTTRSPLVSKYCMLIIKLLVKLFNLIKRKAGFKSETMASIRGGRKEGYKSTVVASICRERGVSNNKQFLTLGNGGNKVPKFSGRTKTSADAASPKHIPTSLEQSKFARKSLQSKKVCGWRMGWRAGFFIVPKKSDHSHKYLRSIGRNYMGLQITRKTNTVEIWSINCGLQNKLAYSR